MTSKRLVASAGLLLLIILSLCGPLFAQTITQGYGSDEPLQKGMLVMLKEKDGDRVTVATPQQLERVHGVVVNANDSPVTLSTDSEKVFVATQGKFEVLVSDENGGIGIGDYITVSGINGIGMKADRRHKVAVAKATAVFDRTKEVVSTQKAGDRTINIGRITADIAVAHNPLAEPEKNSVPEILKAASEVIARKPVSAPRIYAGGIVLFITMVISGGMFYIGVRSGITAIGRNPLSKKDIVRSLLQVILASMVVFIIGLFAVYLLLKI
jgi:hypothetical protein